MNFDRKKIIIQILAFTGLLLTIKLAMIYYVANYEKYALASFCSVNEIIDCDGVARTTAAQFWGIPLAYWGMFFYITVLFLTIVDYLKHIKFLKFLEVFKNPSSYITVLGSVAFCVSMILALISAFRIHKVCILCVITYFVDLGIALVASKGHFKNVIEDFKHTAIDFIDGAKKYTKTFIVLLIASVSFLVYSGVTYNFVPHIKKIQGIKKYRDMKKNPYRVSGNLLGAENPDVTIELYSDFVCPLCYIHNIMLHKAVKEFPNIKVVHYDLPFDKECNPNISINMHPKACFMAKGSIAARNQGNYWEMSSLLYEKQPVNEAEMLKLADKLNFDKEKFLKDFYSEETLRLIEKDIAKSESKGLDSTPTMYVNGDKYVGIMQYDDLRDILIKHGAKRK